MPSLQTILTSGFKFYVTFSSRARYFRLFAFFFVNIQPFGPDDCETDGLGFSEFVVDLNFIEEMNFSSSAYIRFVGFSDLFDILSNMIVCVNAFAVSMFDYV